MSCTIHVTRVDNELIMIAYQPSNPNASFLVGRIFSGNSKTTEVTLNLLGSQYSGPLQLNGESINLSGKYNGTLAPGTYSLALIGINWGGPSAFSVNVNGTAYTSTASSASGVVWTPTPITITV